MKKQIELNHLVGYLPYSLMVTRNGTHFGILRSLISKYSMAEIEFEFGQDRFLVSDIKPSLRPISSMTVDESKDFGSIILNEDVSDAVISFDEITLSSTNEYTISFHTSEYDFVFGFCDKGISMYNSCFVNYNAMEWLFQNHFDLYGLIGKGLAVDSILVGDWKLLNK